MVRVSLLKFDCVGIVVDNYISCVFVEKYNCVCYWVIDFFVDVVGKCKLCDIVYDFFFVFVDVKIFYFN